jgi:hypothetical protein
MPLRRLLALAGILVLSLVLMADSCDVAAKKVKLTDLDSKLEQYRGTKWDGLKKEKIRYAVKTTKDVDQWSKAAAVCYASLIQAEHVADVASKDAYALKNQPSGKTKSNAEKNVKIAQDVLEKAAESAPKLIKEGKDLVSNYKSLISDPTKAPQVLSALKDSLSNLAAVVERAPETAKKLTSISKKLAD